MHLAKKLQSAGKATQLIVGELAGLSSIGNPRSAVGCAVRVGFQLVKGFGNLQPRNLARASLTENVKIACGSHPT